MSIVPHPAGWGEMATGNLGDFFGGADLRTATAVIDLSGGRERQFDYRAYANKIDAVAEMLMRHGLARGARVAILGRNSTEYLDRKSVVEGKSVSVRVGLGGRRIIKYKQPTSQPIMIT